MDSLTHLAMGHAMGLFAAGATPAARTAAYWGAFVGNSLPDIDVPVGHLLGKGWSLHRKFTHTIPGMLVLPALAAGLITLLVPGSSPLLTYAWTFAGVIVHVFVDCLNTFGTRPFQPFSDRFFGYGVLFIMDPVILGVLGLGDLAQLAGWISPAVMKTLYIAMWVYVVARWLMLPRLQVRVREPGVSRYTVTAWLTGWRFLREREGRLELGRVSALGRRTVVLEAVEPARGPAVEASRQVPAVASFLQRARYPFARIDQQGDLYRVEWDDLAGRMRGRPQNALTVLLDQAFRPVEQNTM